MSHVGSRLLADVADRTTLIAELTEALAGLRKPRARPDEQQEHPPRHLRPGKGTG